MGSIVVSLNCRSYRKVHRLKSSIFADEHRRIISQAKFPKELDEKSQTFSNNKLIDRDCLATELKRLQDPLTKTHASNITAKHIATDLLYNTFQQDSDTKNQKPQLYLNEKNQSSLLSTNLNRSDNRNDPLSMNANRNINNVSGKHEQKFQFPCTSVTDFSVEDNVALQKSKAQNDPLYLLEKSLRKKLLARPATMIYDHMAPTSSLLLKTTLISCLPFFKGCSDTELRNKGKFCLPPGHHLVYFHQQVNTSDLLPDGTDDLHSPGYPFERRLWVGGSIDFIRPMILFPKIQMVCSEKITDVRVRGSQNDEKVFVDVTRQIVNPYLNTLELKELRTLVFMRRKNSKEIVERKNSLRPRMEPYFSIIVRPTRTLLFRFSALTFNSHRIHLDSTYCRQVEGLKSMIVQGPLTVVLMLAVLKDQLWNRARISNFTYRNIVPLFVEEDMRICVKKGSKCNGTSTWHVWIEGPSGGYAVKGTATISWVGDQAKFKRNNKQ
ncbi:Hydroxyacyl-thioester dehydratase type 2, mitochondrial [Erysiphe necator]|nr:Hydroxyacyl-thioester dehydratase type 2, mitochondrial [Erysiphe necator]